MEAKTPLGHSDRLKKMDEWRASTKARFDHLAKRLTHYTSTRAQCTLRHDSSGPA
jgi:hypothetical protein